MTDYKYHLDNGIFDIKNGKYKDSLEKLNKSLELKNDWEIPYFYRAVAHQALENLDDAILDYTKALEFNPNMIDAYYNRAKICLSRKDLENPNFSRIEKDLSKAIELDGNFIEALYAMAALKKKLEQFDEAIEHLDRILEIEPDAINAKALKKLILQKYVK